jgi:hypothetical protein
LTPSILSRKTLRLIHLQSNLRHLANGNANGNGNGNNGNGNNGNGNNGNGNSNGVGNSKKLTKPCTLLFREVQGENGADSSGWDCEVDPDDNNGKGGEIIELLDTGFDKDKKEILAGGFLESGVTTFFADDVNVDANGKATVNGNRAFGQNNGNANGNGNGRKLVVSGTKTILAVRVTSFDGVQNTFSDADLIESVFGSAATNANNFNLIKGYNTCSANKFVLTPAADRTGVSTNIADGVVHVTMTNSAAITSNGDVTMRNAVSDELRAQFGVANPTDLANHVMMCVPPGTLDGLAYAFINSWMSVYNDIWCTKPSAQIHELGHNFGLAHS